MGANFAAIVQLEPPANALPQVLDWITKSEVWLAMAVKPTGTGLEFLRVATTETLLEPTACLAKVRVFVITVGDAATPLPLSATISGLELTLLAILSRPVRTPLALGVKTT